MWVRPSALDSQRSASHGSARRWTRLTRTSVPASASRGSRWSVAGHEPIERLGSERIEATSCPPARGGTAPRGAGAEGMDDQQKATTSASIVAGDEDTEEAGAGDVHFWPPRPSSWPARRGRADFTICVQILRIFYDTRSSGLRSWLGLAPTSAALATRVLRGSSDGTTTYRYRRSSAERGTSRAHRAGEVPIRVQLFHQFSIRRAAWAQRVDRSGRTAPERFAPHRLQPDS